MNVGEYRGFPSVLIWISCILAVVGVFAGIGLGDAYGALLGFGWFGSIEGAAVTFLFYADVLAAVRGLLPQDK